METNYRIIAIDFDGTLVHDAWPEIGATRLEILDAAINAQKNGAKIILWSCRYGQQLRDAVLWCEQHGLKLDAINDNIPELVIRYGSNPRKITATEYWDDRAIKC